MALTRSKLKRREERMKRKGVKRKKLGKYVKLQVLANQLYRCNLCNDKLITTNDDINLFDYDHIEQHALTADDSIENIQAICLICHRKKSVREFRQLYSSSFMTPREKIASRKIKNEESKSLRENKFAKYLFQKNTKSS